MIYTLKTKNKQKDIKIDLSQELENQKLQADKDYITSKSYIDVHEKYIWRAWFKSYHMSTYDRKAQFKENELWKQNISIWIVRAFVDVLKASVREKPLVFIWTWINKAGIENKENILNTLKYISDTTWFHTQLKKTMWDWLLTWMICMRVGYKKTNKTEKIISIVNWVPMEEEIEMEKLNTPYAVNIPVFNVFPDPYSWEIRYITERWVVWYEEFIENFWHFIRSKKNKSPFKDYLEYLPVNQNWNVDFWDYWNIVNQVHQKKNLELQQQDFYNRNTNDFQQSPSNINYEDDKNIVEWLIEFKITWRKSRVVLIANGYPVYIWDNPYGFIPYVIKAANETDSRFGEWLPYLIKPLEDVWNSFINNYFDWARALAQPTFVANKNLMINDQQLQDWTPWWVVRTESTDWWNAIYRLDKWWLQDFSILTIVQQIAQQITGISEYNLWIAARERTASWALAVTESSHKRMSPYISNFLDAISEVAYMWLALIKKYWVSEQFIYILDEDWRQVEQAIKNKDLTWWINISLQAEWMFGTINELELQKLISVYQTVAGSWMVVAPEIIKEIIKKTWFDPSRFMVEEKEQQATPDNMLPQQDWEMPDIELPEWVLTNPSLDLWQILQQSVNPQINLGNEWQWQW